VLDAAGGAKDDRLRAAQQIRLCLPPAFQQQLDLRVRTAPASMLPRARYAVLRLECTVAAQFVEHPPDRRMAFPPGGR
jgi:hypothetical protein